MYSNYSLQKCRVNPEWLIWMVSIIVFNTLSLYSLYQKGVLGSVFGEMCSFIHIKSCPKETLTIWDFQQFVASKHTFTFILWVLSRITLYTMSDPMITLENHHEYFWSRATESGIQGSPTAFSFFFSFVFLYLFISLLFFLMPLILSKLNCVEVKW